MWGGVSSENLKSGYLRGWCKYWTEPVEGKKILKRKEKEKKSLSRICPASVLSMKSSHRDRHILTACWPQPLALTGKHVHLMAPGSCAEISALGEISISRENESTTVLLKHMPHGVLVRHTRPRLPPDHLRLCFGVLYWSGQPRQSSWSDEQLPAPRAYPEPDHKATKSAEYQDTELHRSSALLEMNAMRWHYFSESLERMLYVARRDTLMNRWSRKMPTGGLLK